VVRFLVAALCLLTPAVGGAQEVTVRFRDAPVAEVVRALAAVGGASVVVGPGAPGVVNAEIHAQPWERALRAIADAHGMTVREVGTGLLRIDAIGVESAVGADPALVTRVFRLSYLPAADAGRILEGLASPRGRVAVSEHGSAVIVTDTAERVRTMAGILGHAP
jgi:type II secretory pathway component GspD/PulD (secretin)